jgi:methionyl-tRNA formyltransferase
MVSTLFDRLTKCATTLTVDVLKNFDQYRAVPQDDAKSTHCAKVTKQEGLVAFDDAQALYNRYRAFTPWPGVYLESGLKLKKMTLVESTKRVRSSLLIKKQLLLVVKKVQSLLNLFNPFLKKR